MQPLTPDPQTVVAYVGLGANLGQPQTTLAQATQTLSRLEKTKLLAVSPTYRTEPLDAQGPDFFNAVAQLQTQLLPFELLAALQKIELNHGRERPYQNAPRTLDLDLLLYGEQLIQTPTLTVPHPRLHERAFVLRPLNDLTPHLHVPGWGSVHLLLQAVVGQKIWNK
jgi:2-amino-4-hydroxy-6-hydroxymethyldihydropteridine diphosphokinase